MIFTGHAELTIDPKGRLAIPAKHRALLSTIYATGARLNEATHLQVSDIDGERMLVHIRCGKGLKPRMLPMSPALRELLRDYWRAERPRGFLFPGAAVTDPIHPTGVQKVFRLARLQARVDKPAVLTLPWVKSRML